MWMKIAGLLVGIAVGIGGAGAAFAQNVTLADIKSRGTVTVGTEAASFPFEFVENGKIVGYNKDILDRVVASWHVKLNQLDVPFAGLLSGLDQGKYDFVASNLFINPERASRYAFTLPTAAVYMAMAKRKSDSRPITTDNMTGLVVGVAVPPSATHTMFVALNGELAKQGKAAADMKMFQSSPEMFLALQNKQVDIVVLPLTSIMGAMRRLPDQFEVVGRFGAPNWTGWVTRPGDTMLREAIDAELRKLRNSGELKSLQEKWFGFTMDIPDSGYLPAGAK